MTVYQLVDALVTARSDRPGNFRLKFRTHRRSTVTDTAATRTGAASRSPRAAFVTASRELQVQRASSICDIHFRRGEPGATAAVGGLGGRPYADRLIFQKSCRFSPSAEITPIPVIATRRIYPILTSLKKRKALRVAGLHRVEAATEDACCSGFYLIPT